MNWYRIFTFDWGDFLPGVGSWHISEGAGYISYEAGVAQSWMMNDNMPPEPRYYMTDYMYEDMGNSIMVSGTVDLAGREWESGTTGYYMEMGFSADFSQILYAEYTEFNSNGEAI